MTGGPSLSSEMITINDANQVAYVTGMTGTPDEEEPQEDYETGGIFFWTLAGGSATRSRWATRSTAKW